MKENRIKRFNENSELNISDVRSSINQSINEDIYDLFIEFEKSRKKHINEVQDLLHKALKLKDERTKIIYIYVEKSTRKSYENW